MALALDGAVATPEKSAAADNGPSVRALVTARDRAILSAELTSRITTMSPRPGEGFEKGAPLVRFACDRFIAQRDAGKAAVEVAAKSLESIEKLVALKSAGRLKAEIAAAELSGAEAQLRLYQADVRRCTLHAPFSGRVAAWHANPHEIASLGVQIMEIVSESDLELEMIVPSQWLSWLEPEIPLSLFVDETRAAYEAEVFVIGAEVDPVSQTIGIRARFTTGTDGLVPGMSGAAIFPKPNDS